MQLTKFHIANKITLGTYGFIISTFVKNKTVIMKKILIFLFPLTLLFSCHNYKYDAEQLALVRDSLNRESALKDSSLVEYLSDFNEIMTRLDSIKAVEELVTVQQAQQREMTYSQKQKILEDINLLNELIQDNKQQLAAMQKRLNNSNYKVGKLNTMIAELEKMITNLEKKVQEKDTEIARLTGDVQNLTKDVVQLNEKIAVIETESKEKSETIEQQTLEMNKAYYVVGSVKELKESNVLERIGGFLGIGRASEIKKDFNKEMFTEVDLRELNSITLNAKKAEIISVHPAGSYQISGEKSADALVIDNPTEFWSVTRYLVIVVQ